MPQVLSRLQSHGHSYIEDQSDTKGATFATSEPTRNRESSDPNKHIISDYLYKKSQRYHNYKRRWFVLRNCQLSYYKDETEHKALGVVHGANILSINVDDKESHHHKSKFYFKVHTNEKVVQLYADDEPTRDRWIQGLKLAIKYNQKGDSEVEEEEKEEEKDSALPGPPVLNHQETNVSSMEQYSGLDDPNYTSNASDSNANYGLSSAAAPILYPINENRVDHHKVETERLKLRTKLLNGKINDDGKNHSQTNDDEKRALLDRILSADYPHEIIIEKGQMSRLYKRYNQWKKFFIILTNKNLLFYRSSPESLSMSLENILRSEKPSKVMKVDDILDIVELEALSKSKPWCLLIITRQKRVRFSVETEDELVKWLVAITMLTNRRVEKKA